MNIKIPERPDAKFKAILNPPFVALQKIEREIASLSQSDIRSYMRFGELLLEINDKKLYKTVQKTFAAYCQNELGMQRANAYRYITVYKRFGDKSEYWRYDFTQLVVLSAYSDSELEDLKISPSMTVRELNKLLKGEDVAAEGTSTGQDKAERLKERLMEAVQEARNMIDEYEFAQSEDGQNLLDTYEYYLQRTLGRMISDMFSKNKEE